MVVYIRSLQTKFLYTYVRLLLHFVKEFAFVCLLVFPVRPPQKISPNSVDLPVLPLVGVGVMVVLLPTSPLLLHLGRAQCALFSYERIH